MCVFVYVFVHVYVCVSYESKNLSLWISNLSYILNFGIPNFAGLMGFIPENVNVNLRFFLICLYSGGGLVSLRETL